MNKNEVCIGIISSICSAYIKMLKIVKISILESNRLYLALDQKCFVTIFTCKCILPNRTKIVFPPPALYLQINIPCCLNHWPLTSWASRVSQWCEDNLKQIDSVGVRDNGVQGQQDHYKLCRIYCVICRHCSSEINIY